MPDITDEQTVYRHCQYGPRLCAARYPHNVADHRYFFATSSSGGVKLVHTHGVAHEALRGTKATWTKCPRGLSAFPSCPENIHQQPIGFD